MISSTSSSSYGLLGFSGGAVGRVSEISWTCCCRCCCCCCLAIIISCSITSCRFLASCRTRSSYCSCCSVCVFSQTASDGLDVLLLLLLFNATNRACSRCSFSRKLRSANVALHRASSRSLANRRARSNLLSSTVCFSRSAAASASSISFCCSNAAFFFRASSIRRSISAISFSVSSAVLFLPVVLPVEVDADEAPKIPEATPAAVFFNMGLGIGSLIMSLLLSADAILPPFFCIVAQSGFSH